MKSIDQENLQNSLNILLNVICQFEMNQILMKLSLLLLQFKRKIPDAKFEPKFH